MAESIVSDWLADYSSLEASEIRAFAAQHEYNYEVASALFVVLNERLKYPDLLYSICNQFFNFYRSNEIDLRKFTLQFLPTLIYIYLNAVAQGDKKNCRSVETLLISIYNIEISNDKGEPKLVTFRMPVLAHASIYHEEKNLNATDLRRWEENGNKEINWGTLQQVETVNAQNRIKVMAGLLFIYNQQLSIIQKSALSHLCRVASLLANQGFSKPGHAHRSSYGSDPNNSIAPKPLPRIPMSSHFLLELLHAVYFSMYNEFGSIAIQTVDDIHNRACYELYPEVILVTNAVKNSLRANLSGQPSDGPMGISVALTPVTTTTTVSKSMITNASFRTKKLPDDIPIQGPKDEFNNQLLSISEESENDQLGNRNIANRRSKENVKLHKVPFPGFKKSKEKDKDTKTALYKNGVSIEKDVAKQGIKKDKFTNRGSLQSSVDMTDNLEKSSPIPILKRKSSYIDINNGTILLEMVPLQSLTNGTTSEEKPQNDSINTSVDATESVDTSTEESVAAQRTSTTSDGISHMQVW